MNKQRLAIEATAVFVIGFAVFIGYFMYLGGGNIVSITPLKQSSKIPTFSQMRDNLGRQEPNYDKIYYEATLNDNEKRRKVRDALIEAGTQLALSPCNTDFKLEYIKSATIFLDARIAATKSSWFGEAKTDWKIDALDQPVIDIMQSIHRARLVTKGAFQGRKRKMFYAMFSGPTFDGRLGIPGDRGYRPKIESCE